MSLNLLFIGQQGWDVEMGNLFQYFACLLILLITTIICFVALSQDALVWILNVVFHVSALIPLSELITNC